MNKKSLNRRQRLTLGFGAAGAAAVLGLGGVFAAFTGTVSSAAQSIGTGTVSMVLDPASGSTTALFTQTVTGMVPGDVHNRFINLRNASTFDLTSPTLTVTDSPGTTLLGTDATNGLKITVDKCSVAWTVASNTCSGTLSSVVAQTSLSAFGTAQAMNNVAPLTAGGSTYLRVSVTLPSAATNTAENLTEALTYKFDATAVAGTAH